MATATGRSTGAPPPPRVRLSLGVTGHRGSHPELAANAAAVAETLGVIADLIDGALGRGAGASAAPPPRLHTMLSDGADQLAADLALARGWELTAPLPFGRALNRALNVGPRDAAEARSLCADDGALGEPTAGRVARLRALETRAVLFELADQDEAVKSLLLASLSAPEDADAARRLEARVSERVSLAGRVMIEHADLILAVWDGAFAHAVGGTGHTIGQALELGAPVVWIDARAPHCWRVLRAAEALVLPPPEPTPDPGAADALKRVIREAMEPAPGRRGGAHAVSHHGPQALEAERWRPRSHRVWHAYRRIEALFGARTLAEGLRDLTQTYEAPSAVATGSAAAEMTAARALPGQDPAFVARVEAEALHRFAWADGVAARLSDAYRGGMILSFVLSAFAIAAGVAWLPFASLEEKWMFALAELVLLVGVLALTITGQRRRWHGRWFETRRVAEYFRHAPILLLLGVGRPTGRWPRGADTSWPEWYARHALRELGLPPAALTPAYLRGAITGLLRPHVVQQRDYHRGKAERLARAHARLDRLSETLFFLAVLSVGGYLLVRGASALGLVDHAVALRISPLSTFLGVLFPTLGAGLAGIRYFGDFERFSAISEITAEKLDVVATRIDLLLAAPEAALDYGRVADLAHAADEIVVAEIENWQSVFGGKHTTVPV